MTIRSAFADASIRTKLRILILGISVLAVLGSCTVFITYLWFSTRARLVRRQDTFATVIADQSTAALDFDQPLQATALLNSLKAERQVVAAAIYTPQGRLFATYVRDGAAPGLIRDRPEPDGQRFEEGDLLNFHPIVSGGERVGTLHLRSDLTDLRDRVLVVSGTAVLVLVGATLLVFYLSTRLGGLVTGRVLQLSDLAERVAKQKDYSLRMAAGGRDEMGHLIGGFNEMLSQIQARDRALASARDDLERRVLDRTVELEERMSELAALNKELEGFSYSVSHDLRAPLRAIDGFSRMLLEDYGNQLEGDARRYLDNITSNTRKMGQLIDDLLSFARLGRKALESSPIELDQMAREVFDELRQLTPDRPIDLRLGPLPSVTGDPAMFRQVFTNLISNAIKYTRGRSPAVIEIGSRADSKEVTVYVRDNGVGFEMEFAGKLFGVFQRLHSAKEFEGTGVGLALVQRIVQRHGGRTWAEGKVGEGACFYFALPTKGHADQGKQQRSA
ncbi:MAG TPA: ATP-binding protein [Planctomycetota bacterium]|nr:ATP-binding protein [Planctomycetota bacterium]